MYPRGKNEYLVSDPRLTVSEAAGLRRSEAVRMTVSCVPSDSEQGRFLLSVGYKPDADGVIRAQSIHAADGDCDDDASESDAPTVAELDAFMSKNKPWPSVRAYTAAMLKDLTLLLSAGEAKYVECVGDETHFAGPTLPAEPLYRIKETSTNQQPTEAEQLAIELAKPPRGVSVEQWRAYVASRSELSDGRPRGDIDTSDLVFWRNLIESGQETIPERIMKHAPAVKKNWWE